MKRTVALRDLSFYAHHGAYKHEQELGQPFLIDVEVAYDFSQGAREDALRKVINYRQIYGVVADVMQEGPFKLIESIAERVADRILAGFPVSAVSVTVKKPWAQLGGMSGYSEVRVDKP